MKTAPNKYLVLLVFLSFFASFLFRSDLIEAAETDSVTATVTVQNISVSVSDGSVSYGTLALNASANTTATGLNDSQTATNDGNITLELNIQGQNSAAWTLGAAAGANTYVHEYCVTDCDGTPTWEDLTTSYQTLNASVASSGTQVFDLRLTTPTSTVSYTQQSVDVTVQAALP